MSSHGNIRTKVIYLKIYFISIYHIQYMSSTYCEYTWHSIYINCCSFNSTKDQIPLWLFTTFSLPTRDYFFTSRFLFTALYFYFYITLQRWLYGNIRKNITPALLDISCSYGLDPKRVMEDWNNSFIYL